MKILHTNASQYYTNVYFYYDENSLEAAVIDPGGSVDKLIEMAAENGLKLKYILLTHGHYDHTAGVDELKVSTGAEVMAHEAEDELLKNTDLNLSLLAGGRALSVVCDKLLKEGDVIEVGAGRLSVIHTPGHTGGGACFYDKENGILFSGDTLFRGTTGRYDLPTAHGQTLFNSIKNKLYTLPDDTKVLPGHDVATTIGWEKANNQVVGYGL